MVDTEISAVPEDPATPVHEEVRGSTATTKSEMAESETADASNPTSPSTATPAEMVSAASPPAEMAGTTHLRGGFERYEIGDPGRAFGSVVSRQDSQFSWVPDTILDGVTVEDGDDTPRLEVRAASVRGLSHRHASKVRQDDYAFALSTDRKYLVAVVADGVSAGHRSHMAADIAANAGCWDLTGLLATTPVEEVDWLAFLQRLADRMAAKAATAPGRKPTSSRPSPREVAEDMATTVIVGVVEIKPSDDGAHVVHIIRLGDTSGWIIRPDCVWVPLGDVKNEGAAIAESATSGLPFVPTEAPPLVTARLAAGETLVLMTDGIGDPLGAGGGEVGAALAEYWATPPPPIQFAAQIDFGRKSFDDDRTAVAVWPTEG